MTYQKFLENLKAEIENFNEVMGEEVVELFKVRKLNIGELDAVKLKNSPCSPVVHVKNYYEQFKNVPDDKSYSALTHIMNDLNTPHANEEKTIMEKNINSDMIIMQLVNYEKNAHMLTDVPYRKWHDLAIVYKLQFDIGKTALISNEIMKILKMNEDELYHVARWNTSKLNPHVITSMDNVLKKLMVDIGLDDEDMECGSQMYVINNIHGINGAIYMTYPSIYTQLASELNADLYILPCSVHEVIALPNKMLDVSELVEMVHSTNREHVSDEDFLSNSVYYYSRELNQIKKVG